MTASIKNGSAIASNYIEVLKNAIAKYGAPEITNAEQGRQFTCLERKETRA